MTSPKSLREISCADDYDPNSMPVVKARELSGQDGLLFWRNSQTGAIEVRAKRNAVELNSELHAN